MNREPLCWTVYLIECSDGTFYCGVCLSERLENRLNEHNSGKGARYTSGRTPVSLRAKRSMLTRRQAYQLEFRVKKRPRWEKIEFLNTFNLDHLEV